MSAHVRVLWGVASVAFALSGCSDVESGSGGGSGASGGSSPDAAVPFTVSAEQNLGSVELSLATASQRLGRVVARSGEYLAFHRDERFGSGWYATRVAADGNVIDPKGTRLFEEQDEEPDAAAGLSGYAFSSVKCAGECEVVLTHLGASGPEVSVTRTVLEKSDSYHMSDAHVGRTDQGFLVVWTRAANPASPPSGGEGSIGVPPEARAMRIGPDGEVLDAKPTYLGKVRTGQLVGTGSKLMMIGRDSSGLFAAPVVTSPYVVLGQPTPLVAAQPYKPRAAWGAGMAAVVWPDVSGIRLVRITEAGVSLDNPPKQVAPWPSGSSLDSLDIAFVADEFRVTWGDKDASNGEHTRLARVSTSGAVGAWSVAAPTRQLVWSSDGSGVRAFGTTAAEISRLATAADGPLPLTLTPVTRVANAQEGVSLASAPSNIASAWVERHDDSGRVVVTQGPSLASPSWIKVLGSTARACVLARRTDQSLVTWVETLDERWRTRAMRLSSAGEPIDPTPITLPQSEGGESRCDQGPAVAASDSGFLVLRQSDLCESGYWTPRVCGLVLAPNSALQDLGCDPGLEPAAIHLAPGFFVAWNSLTHGGLAGRRVDTSAGLAAPPMYVFQMGTKPSLATDGKRVLTAFQKIDKGGSTTSKVFAALHDATFGAEVKSAFQLSDDDDVTEVRATYDASSESYWIVWRCSRSPDLSVARLDTTGAVLMGARSAFAIPMAGNGITATPSGTGELLVGYSRLDEGLGSMRLGIRALVPTM